MSLFTIITVCYNTENEIKRTIESVLSQSCRDYEYLVVDGASKDKTVSVAESYREAFERKGVQYRIKSEKDTGIYDAMNKGTDMASGKWLLFLNAGDYLTEERVLEKVAAYDCDDAAVLYGDVIWSICDLFKRGSASPLEKLKTGMAFCHQSAFIRKDKMQEYRYDETFRIGADYDFFCRCYHAGEKLKKIDVTVSVFEMGGASGRPQSYILEYIEIQRNNSFITEEEYERKKKRLEKKKIYYELRSALVDRIPQKLLIKLKRQKSRRQGFKEKELVL